MTTPSDTVESFCESERCSVSHYYNMRREQWGPDEMWIGNHVTISTQAKALWRREREAAAKAGIRRALPPELKRQVREQFEHERARFAHA